MPSVAVIALACLATPGLGWVRALMLNDVLGPRALGAAWRSWFVEALLQVVVLVGLLLQVPALGPAERRPPFAFPTAVLGVGLLTRFDVVPLGTGPVSTQFGPAVFWLFALGWSHTLAGAPRFPGRPVAQTVAALLVGFVTWRRARAAGWSAADSARQRCPHHLTSLHVSTSPGGADCARHVSPATCTTSWPAGRRRRHSP